MIISFMPVFALSGMEGKMFHPLAYTKTFALIGVSVLAITLVPALIPWLVRGRIRHEEDSWIVRRVVEVYRPVLAFVMDHPWPVVWVVGVIYLLGAVPTGSPWLFSIALCVRPWHEYLGVLGENAESAVALGGQPLVCGPFTSVSNCNCERLATRLGSAPDR